MRLSDAPSSNLQTRAFGPTVREASRAEHPAATSSNRGRDKQLEIHSRQNVDSSTIHNLGPSQRCYLLEPSALAGLLRGFLWDLNRGFTALGVSYPSWQRQFIMLIQELRIQNCVRQVESGESRRGGWCCIDRIQSTVHANRDQPVWAGKDFGLEPASIQSWPRGFDAAVAPEPSGLARNEMPRKADV